MANSPQARKRARQAEGRRQRNVHQRTGMRTKIKNVLKTILTGDKSAAVVSFKISAANLDKMAGKGLIHKNKAARCKSRLHARIRKMDEAKAA